MATLREWMRYGKRMVRGVILIISAFSFVAGIVGWITFPDDAMLWPERLGPVLSGMSKEDLIIVLFGISALGIAFLLFAPKLHSMKNSVGTLTMKIGRSLVDGSASPMSLVFPRCTNDDDLFQQNRKLIGIFQENEMPIVAMEVVWRIGVKNTLPDKTIKHAGVRVTTRNGASFPLRVSDKEDEYRADIAPRMTVYFDIGFFTVAPQFEIKRFDDAKLVPKIVADRIRSEKSKSLKFFAEQKSRLAHIENEDKSKIKVDVYADDIQPIHADIICHLNENPSMSLI